MGNTVRYRNGEKNIELLSPRRNRPVPGFSGRGVRESNPPYGRTASQARRVARRIEGRRGLENVKYD